MWRLLPSPRSLSSLFPEEWGIFCDTLFGMRLLVCLVWLAPQALALERTGVEFKIFQFPSVRTAASHIGRLRSSPNLLKAHQRDG